MPTKWNVQHVVRGSLVICLFISWLTPVASSVNKPKPPGVDRFLHSAPAPGVTRYDARQHDVKHQSEPTAIQQAALAQLQQQINGVEVRFSPATATIRHLFSLSQRLTTPSHNDAVTIATDYLRRQRTLFRLTDQEIDHLVIRKNYRTEHNGVTHLVFQQYADGLPVFQGEIRVNIDRDGQILSLNGDYFPGVASLVEPALTATEAVEHAVRLIWPDIDFKPTVKSSSDGLQQIAVFDRGPFTDDIRVALTLFPIFETSRLAWNFQLHRMGRQACYDAIVDAQTGEILYVRNLYNFVQAQPQGSIFETNPDEGAQVLKSFAGDPVASTGGWVSPLPNIRAQGNNVVALPSLEGVQQHFEFPFTNAYLRNGGNRFDLNQRTLRFTPNGTGGYSVQNVALSFDANLGTNMTAMLGNNTDDNYFPVNLGFSFSFFGSNYTSLFMSTNGYVTFDSGDSDFTESWFNMLTNGSPRIALAWDDLNPGQAAVAGAGMYVKTGSDRVTLTWNLIPQHTIVDSNTFQLTLLRTGVIEMSYNGVVLPDALVGISPGLGDVELNVVDFSANPTISNGRAGIAEKFPSSDRNAAMTNLFYHFNFIHDYLHKLGFNEAAGNFQMNNFGRGGLGNDPVRAYAQDGTGGLPFFFTPVDGQSPIALFPLFTTTPGFRQIDSSFDADILYHEYAHGLTNRLVGGPANVSALEGFQSVAMGEGWSDIYAASILNDPIFGEYVSGNRTTGMRKVDYSKNQLIYGDFGNRSGPVAANDTIGIGLDRSFVPDAVVDGEIWASVLWDLRQGLGKAVFEKLITDALKLTPLKPSMLDGRDAILMADVASNRGANAQTIRSIFAARGMGFSARSSSSNDTIVFQAFDTPTNPIPANKTTTFFDDMSNGANGWAVLGGDGANGPALWHQSSRRLSLAWYYGREDTGNYNTGATARNLGALTSPRIDLRQVPRDSVVTLEFDHFLRRQDVTSTFSDLAFVRVLDGSNVVQVACVVNDAGTAAAFEHEEINISQFAGRQIRIQLYFDTLNQFNNDGEGWYVDNLRVSHRTP